MATQVYEEILEDREARTSRTQLFLYYIEKFSSNKIR